MKKPSATIFIGGIVSKSYFFNEVSDKQFFLSLTQLDQDINIDSRLKKTHNLETYHIDIDRVEDLRHCQILTTLVGYSYKSSYYTHYSLCNMIAGLLSKIDKYDLNAIKANLNIKEFTPIKVKRIC